jgi:hypothetical protein
MDWILCLIAGALAGSLVSMTGSGAGFTTAYRTLQSSSNKRSLS